MIAVEIKSRASIDPVEVRKLARVAQRIKATAVFYVSQDPVETLIDGVRCLPWKKFFEERFEFSS